MSMLTRCPECSTSFRITTDQLVSRQGKVRCGRCHHVFSALGSLVHTREPVAPSPSGPVTAPDAGPPSVSPAPSKAGGGAAPAPAAEAPPSLPGMTYYNSGPRSLAGHTTDLQDEEDEEDGEDEGYEGDDGTTESRPRRRRRRRGQRVAWLSLLGVIAATVALGAQAAYFYRNQLAVIEPNARPWLDLMCARLACRIETPLDPQAISIESSALEADPADKTLLQLAALLRNRSSLPQNLPYLELTLLDAQEGPLARRVLRPEEYALRNPPPGRQLPADGEYQVRLSLDASALKANGYRLYAFYP